MISSTDPSSMVVPSVQVHVVGFTPAPHGFLTSIVIIIRVVKMIISNGQWRDQSSYKSPLMSSLRKAPLCAELVATRRENKKT